MYDFTLTIEIIIRQYCRLSLLLILQSNNLYKCLNYILQARFACLRCAAGGHFVPAGGALWAPVVTLINYKGDNISKYVCPTIISYIAGKITKFINF